MERTTKKALVEKYDHLAARYAERGEELSAARTAKREAEERLKESREHFTDLKERLHNAETELARLRGYLDRVHEDDIVRDGMIEIEDEQGKRQVPKRPQPMMAITHHNQFSSGFDQYGRPKKQTHWTSY